MLKQNIKTIIKKGGAHIVIGSFFTKFISFFGSIFIVRFLTKEEYGVLAYWENVLGYFVIISGLGLAVGVQRYMILADSEGRKKHCFIYSLRRSSIWNIFIVLIYVIFCFVYPHPTEFRGYFIVMVCLGLCIPFIFIINLSLSALRALFDHKKYAYIAFLTSALLILFRVVGAGLGGLNLSVIFRLIAEVISAFICLYIIFSCHLRLIKIENNPKIFIKQLNRYSLQMMLTDGLWTIFMLNDIFLLGQFSGNTSIVADYKVAMVIPANLSILTASVGIFASPYFTKNENDKIWVKKHLSLLLAVTIFVVGLAALLCILFSETLLTFIYGVQYKNVASIMRILLIAAFVGYGIRATIANVLSSMGRQQINLIVAVIGVVLQLILDIVLIPSYGAFGVAWSSVIVYSVMALLLVYYTFRQILGNCNILEIK